MANTAIATVATSSRRETSEARSRGDKHYAASVEEVEDEEALKAKKKPTLPTNGRHTMMNESEVVNHSEKGEVGPNRPIRDTKSTKSVENPQGTKLTPVKEDHERQEKRTRLLFDRPKPPPRPEWLGDPRLPVELNEVISAMWPYNNHGRSTEHDEYREPQPSEISETVEFMSYIRPSEPVRRKQQTPRFRLPTIDESKLAIEALAKRHERNNLKIRPEAVALDKGKTGSNPLTEDDVPRLKQQWYDKYKEILQGTKEELPPLREVNHEINLIDPNAKYTYHLPRCPVALREQFHEKLNRYIDAGWWEPRTTAQAAPLMCIPKKDGRLRTVIDARQRNDNTVKDVTPLPDQDIIREDVARAPIRSKIDLADAYEQVRVRPEDVGKTAFATISGTLVSNVVQQGDCNAPATFQRLMTAVFRDVIGKFMHVYLDDIFIFSSSREEHEQHLGVIFERLKRNNLYLKWAKCDLYAREMDCLGHIIDDKGVHTDADKLQRIREWRTPRNYNDIQRFVGLINYVANFLPGITTYTAPLQGMVQNGAPFFWRPIHQRCFDMIKRICYKTPILRPINYRSDEPVWLICDASKTGVGAMYGQGPTWNVCRPAGFMSKKFTYAQQHYSVHELETLAILEALQKWEDKLIGRRLHVITDHKALEFFKTQAHLSSRQRRWMDYMSKFDFDITYIKGEYNKVADCLSRYYESDTSADVHEFHDYVQADRRIDPDGEDLPMERLQEVKERVVEIRAMHAMETRRSLRLRETQERREEEADAMRQPEPIRGSEEQSTRSTPMDDNNTLGRMIRGERSKNATPLLGLDQGEDNSFLDAVKKGYPEDPLTKIVLERPENYSKSFIVKDDLIWTHNPRREQVIVVPRKRELITKIITQAHEVVGHMNEWRTLGYAKRWFWWPRMAKLIEEFCRSCDACQRSKGPSTLPVGKLHSLPVPTKPWDSIGMDFVGPFPESRGYDYLWVVICRMTSMVHLIPVTTRITAKELSWEYLKEIVRLHGLPSSIVSDRDSKFTSKWWRELHRLIGAKLLMSTSFHPQTDGQSERAIRNITQILRAVVRSDQKDWTDKIPMTEFAINASVSKTTGYAPFELNGGYMPSMIKEI